MIVYLFNLENKTLRLLANHLHKLSVILFSKRYKHQMPTTKQILKNEFKNI
jgi:hypothetical protein